VSDLAKGSFCLLIAVAMGLLLISQWRTGKNLDLTFDLATETLPKARRPLLWFSTVVYGFVAVALLFAGIGYFT